MEARTGLVFVRGARLTDDQLRLFREPRGWRTIVTTPGARYGDDLWWRSAVMDADELGRGLLRWEKETRRWGLSERGRKHLGLEEE